MSSTTTALDTRTSLYRRFHQSTNSTSTSTDFKSAFPLRRLSSKASSTYSASNPFDTASTISTVPSTSASLLSHTSDTTIKAPEKFIPRTKLQVQCYGHGFWALPLPLKELETHIYSINDGPEDPDCARERAEGRRYGPDLNGHKYISIRPERSKGNCALFWADDREREMQLSRTTYRWGPYKNPMVRIGADDELGAVEFECKSKWMSKSVSFTYNSWNWEWRYGGKKERARVSGELGGEEVDDVLLLERVGMDGGRKVVARFIRGPESRTPGTKKSDSGNGGRLEMCFRTKKFMTRPDPYVVLDSELDGVERDEMDVDPGIDEPTVISTVLVMLKREVDRMRGWQMAAIDGPCFYTGYGIRWTFKEGLVGIDRTWPPY